MSSISDVVIHDHRELKDYYDQIIAAVEAKDLDRAVRYRNQLAWELARHSIAEELVVYPSLEKHLPNGKQMADNDRREHLTVKQELYKFQSMNPDVIDFLPTIKALWKDLDEHIKGEERDDLPALEKAMADTTESVNLAKEFQTTKHFVPTRSHPSAPDKPPFETIAGLLAAPMDKLGDMFRKFPRD